MRSSRGENQAPCPGCEKLRKEVQKLQGLLKEALERLAQSEKRLEELEREGKRQAAPFRVPEKKRQEAIRRILGDDFPGVLISDCLASYDPHPGRKSKCCSHHLKAISEALDQAPGSQFLRQVRTLFKASILWHSLRDEIDPADYIHRAHHLERDLDRLLAEPPGHHAERRIRKRLTKQRPHLLPFLRVPGVYPTNNLAERQLRPAVITRKLSCGNKTANGAATFEVLTSLAATCRQQGRSFVQLVNGGLSLTDRPPPLFTPA